MHNATVVMNDERRICELVLICSQMPVFRVFYLYVRKMNSSVSAAKQRIYWIHDNFINRVIHRLGLLRTFGQQQEISRCERGFAEGAEPNAVTLLGEENCSIQYQP